MKLLAGEDLESFFRIYKHDSGNNLSIIRIFLEQALKTGSKDFIEKAQLVVNHEMLIRNALDYLRTEDTQKDSWLEGSDELNLDKIVSTALFVAEDHRDVYNPQMQVSKKVDDLTIHSNELFYRYLYNGISNAFKSLRKKAYKEGTEQKPFGYYDFSFGPKLDIICERVGSEAKIVLRDNGIGMSEEQIKKIGEKGHSDWQGSGLGLAFMNIVLPKIGIRYEVESKPLEYAQFTFYAAIKR